MYYLHRANKIDDLYRAIREGMGVEIDVRSVGQQLIVSHEPVSQCNIISQYFTDFLDIIIKCHINVIFDIKESGIIDLIDSEIKKYSEYNNPYIYFADLIVPDMLYAESLGYKTLARQSKYEKIEGTFYGYWLDYIDNVCDLPKKIKKHTFLVSPELHSNDLTDDFIAAVQSDDGFEGICTDYPERYHKIWKKHCEEFILKG